MLLGCDPFLPSIYRNRKLLGGIRVVLPAFPDDVSRKGNILNLRKILESPFNKIPICNIL
jgi:hypothetical protein